MRKARSFKGYLYGLGSGVAAGASMMYLLDPAWGRRRRRLAEEKAYHAIKETDKVAISGLRDLSHRTRGLFAELASAWKKEGASDPVLYERVRSKLGRLTTHPHAIEVSVRDGRVEVRGPILKNEVDKLLVGLSAVRGVKGIDNRLEIHETARGIPSLQGTGRIPRGRLWPPAARLAATTAGTGLALIGLRQRGPIGWSLAGTGALLTLRGATDLDFKRLFGFSTRRRVIDLTKTININAPIEEVFSFFQSFENFPRFMSHVKSVERIGDNRWRWTVEGPARVPFSWDAEVTRFVPNKVLAWKSLGDAAVKSAGTIHFDKTNGGTRLHIRMGYNPPAGALGHAFLKIFRADPRRQMHDDLLRFKSLIERGKATGHETVRREEVMPQRPLH
ncbi:MAG: SRPBCC family protein [Myxococcales bacterium]|jgi:uncharacterized membrane protein